MTKAELMQVIKQRLKRVNNLTDIEADNQLRKISISDLKAGYRKELNAIRDSIIQYNNTKGNYDAFVKEFNEVLREAKALGIETIDIELPDPRKVMKETNKNIVSRFEVNKRNAIAVLTGKANYLNDLLAKTSGKAFIEKPRTTLLQISNFTVDRGKVKKVNFGKDFEKKINTMVNRGIKGEESTGKIRRMVSKEINKKIPNTHFYYQTKKGLRKESIPYYAESYVLDFRAKQQNYGAISAISLAGGDIVFIDGPTKTDKVCAQFAGNYYSLSGNSKNYPELTIIPPYHRNCQHKIKSAFDKK